MSSKKTAVRKTFIVVDGRKRQVFRDRLGRFAVKPRRTS